MRKQNLAASEVQTYKLLLYDYKKTWCINESDIAIKTKDRNQWHTGEWAAQIATHVAYQLQTSWSTGAMSVILYSGTDVR